MTEVRNSYVEFIEVEFGQRDIDSLVIEAAKREARHTLQIDNEWKPQVVTKRGGDGGNVVVVYFRRRRSDLGEVVAGIVAIE